MLFNTLQYGVFFILVFTLHWILPEKLRRPFLLLASYYFYASAIPQYIFLILGLTLGNYLMGRWMGRAHGRIRTIVLVLTIIGNLGSLAYFKYTTLILSTLQPVLNKLPLLQNLSGEPFLQHVILPLGISFFTFEFIHYIVEVFRGHEPIRPIVDFALFAAFFPTQIAGPIKRFPDFMKQIAHPLKLREVDIDHGIWLIVRGLVKKVVIADTLAPVVAQLFGPHQTLGAGTAWFAVFAFTAQIYCDFSGYTDMGRGSATLLGYAVPENFNSPYQSKSPSEFWYRWHISLSSWLRDYLYFPLGGSRVAKPRIYLNLLLTMALGGLWHGASWHFMVWGIYQGVLLCCYRLWEQTIGKTGRYQRFIGVPIIGFFRLPLTLIYVCLGWVFFRAATLGDAARLISAMFDGAQPFFAGFPVTPLSSPVLCLAACGMVTITTWSWQLVEQPITTVVARTRLALWLAPAQLYALRPVASALAILLVLLWPPHEVQRFIYFQF